MHLVFVFHAGLDIASAPYALFAYRRKIIVYVRTIEIVPYRLERYVDSQMP